MTVTVRTPRRRPVFHPLPVVEIRALTEDSVAVTFDVAAALRETFAFSPGQHVTLRRHEDGLEVRRSYSVFSTPGELRETGRLRIGVRRIVGGVFSAFAASGLRVGDELEVLAPLGRFTTAVTPGRRRHYAAVAAGSGITPVLSLIATALSTEVESRFSLVYVNRRATTVMFADDLADLKDRYPGRLQIVHVLSREAQLSELLSGRLDAQRTRTLLDSGLLRDDVDEWFLCGPYGLVMDVRGVLAERGVPDRAVHTELFHVEDANLESSGRERREPAPVRTDVAADAASGAALTVRLDGRESSVTMYADERVLDAALRVRPELPYACRGGVCSTCRARLVSGTVSMAHNYALEPDEMAAGFVLTCQSTATSASLSVDYDG